MSPNYLEHLQKTLREIEDAGLFKQGRVITTPLGDRISTTAGNGVLNFCANVYHGRIRTGSWVDS